MSDFLESWRRLTDEAGKTKDGEDVALKWHKRSVYVRRQSSTVHTVHGRVNTPICSLSLSIHTCYGLIPPEKNVCLWICFCSMYVSFNTGCRPASTHLLWCNNQYKPLPDTFDLDFNQHLKPIYPCYCRQVLHHIPDIVIYCDYWCDDTLGDRRRNWCLMGEGWSAFLMKETALAFKQQYLPVTP